MGAIEPYDWWACPCCAYRVSNGSTPGTLAVCPVCHWLDVPLEDDDERIALYEAQRSFAAIGASALPFVDRVRAPTAAEARRVPWEPGRSPAIGKVMARESVRRAIADAFADVDRTGGASLRDAYRADAYGHESDHDWDDRDQHWSEIPDDVLEYFGNACTVFLWGNSITYRYYLPAYMRWALQGPSDDALYAITMERIAETDGTTVRPHDVLTSEQRAAVRAFVWFLARYYPSHDDTEERLLHQLEAEEGS